jgi:hypothetical protein
MLLLLPPLPPLPLQPLLSLPAAAVSSTTAATYAVVAAVITAVVAITNAATLFPLLPPPLPPPLLQPLSSLPSPLLLLSPMLGEYLMDSGRGVLLPQKCGGINSEIFSSTLDLIVNNLITLFISC